MAQIKNHVVARKGWEKEQAQSKAMELHHKQMQGARNRCVRVRPPGFRGGPRGRSYCGVRSSIADPAVVNGSAFALPQVAHSPQQRHHLSIVLQVPSASARAPIDASSGRSTGAIACLLYLIRQFWPPTGCVLLLRSTADTAGPSNPCSLQSISKCQRLKAALPQGGVPWMMEALSLRVS